MGLKIYLSLKIQLSEVTHLLAQGGVKYDFFLPKRNNIQDLGFITINLLQGAHNLVNKFSVHLEICSKLCKNIECEVILDKSSFLHNIQKMRLKRESPCLVLRFMPINKLGKFLLYFFLMILLLLYFNILVIHAQIHKAHCKTI